MQGQSADTKLFFIMPTRLKTLRYRLGYTARGHSTPISHPDLPKISRPINSFIRLSNFCFDPTPTPGNVALLLQKHNKKKSTSDSYFIVQRRIYKKEREQLTEK